MPRGPLAAAPLDSDIAGETRRRTWIRRRASCDTNMSTARPSDRTSIPRCRWYVRPMDSISWVCSHVVKGIGVFMERAGIQRQRQRHLLNDTTDGRRGQGAFCDPSSRGDPPTRACFGALSSPDTRTG